MFNQIPDEKGRNNIIKSIMQKNISRYSVGTSVCGRKIEAFEIGCPKQVTLFAGAFHGMEWLTSSILLKFLYDISNDDNILKKLERKGIIIIPCVNPDGVEISLHGAKSCECLEKFIEKISKGDTSSWQANAHGVDINHNFDADWYKLKLLEIKEGITCPGPTRFGGFYPQSEPETKAMIKICEERNINLVLAMHSQGEEIYWKYGKCVPRGSYEIAKCMSDLSGYMLSSPEEMASFGGFKDWFIKCYNRPGFTVEIGKGKNPLPLNMLEEIYKKIRDMLVFCAIGEHYSS